MGRNLLLRTPFDELMLSASDNTYLAVVPAYNEAETIERVIAGLDEHAPRFDVVVVDDGSTDETRERAEAAGAQVLRLPFNLGIGGAVQAGFVYALENGYDYMVQVDGDGQHDPAEIHNLIAGMDDEPGIDMVCGSRFLGRGPSTRRRSAGGPASTSSPSCSRASSASA